MFNRLQSCLSSHFVFTSLFCLLLAGCQEDPPPAAKRVNPSVGQAAPVADQAVQARPIAPTRAGPVRGFFEDDIAVFKGIRYGADTATTRFAAPAAPQPWSQPADALAYGNSAPQASRGSIGLFDSWVARPSPAQSEDCLFLNVWTPAVDRIKRPVMVWLHGGGFSTGSGSSNAYDGVRLAQRGDVVVVTVNHRLNVFGYTYLDHFGESFAGSANAGMLDLVAALRWVQANIREFGGDPDNVTIFGESGGGFKVSTLMSMPAATGLFHKAVIQSGPGLELMTAEAATLASDALVAELGLTAATIDQIRSLPTQTISDAAAAVAQAGGPVVGSRPVVDGVHNLRHPFTPDAPTRSAQIPLLIGSTQTEMSLLAGARMPQLFDLTWDTLPAALAQAIPGLDAEAVIAGYRELHPELSAAQLYFEATTDNSVFVRGSFELADRKSNKGGAPIYQYYLTWNTPVDDGKWGAPHALDIGFVFDNVAKSESMSGTGPRQQRIADMMSEAWIAFARTGDPNHAGLPNWEPYDSEHRATMIFDDQPELVVDPRRAELDLIDMALASP